MSGGRPDPSANQPPEFMASRSGIHGYGWGHLYATVSPPTQTALAETCTGESSARCNG